MARKTLTTRKTSPQHKCIGIELPPEFIALCKHDGIDPEFVLRSFIADLCAITSWANNPRADYYQNNGSDERRMAREYYERVGYPWWHHEPD
jgi:hypothetical protein